MLICLKYQLWGCSSSGKFFWFVFLFLTGHRVKSRSLILQQFLRGSFLLWLFRFGLSFFRICLCFCFLNFVWFALLSQIQMRRNTYIAFIEELIFGRVSCVTHFSCDFLCVFYRCFSVIWIYLNWLLFTFLNVLRFLALVFYI